MTQFLVSLMVALLMWTSDDPKVRAPVMTRLAEQGNAEAQRWLADYYTYTVGDKELGEQWKLKAAESGSVEAMKSLWYTYEDLARQAEDEAERDALMAKSDLWLFRAAARGEPRAQLEMAYQFLKASPEDEEALQMAVSWLRRAARENNYGPAQEELCRLYATWGGDSGRGGGGVVSAVFEGGMARGLAFRERGGHLSAKDGASALQRCDLKAFSGGSRSGPFCVEPAPRKAL